MTINNEQLRRENDILKDDNTQLRNNIDKQRDEIDAMKDEITQLKDKQKDEIGQLTNLLVRWLLVIKKLNTTNKFSEQ